ncbi:MAG: FlgD immunoglobulin-like domain containing protein, partial [Candidatus Eiseniibacteriota bacterium]
VIPFDLPRESQVRLEVFDLLGRRVATVVDATYPGGTHAVEWDLRDASGGTVRPGVYVYRMSAGQFRAQRKMSVLP